MNASNDYILMILAGLIFLRHTQKVTQNYVKSQKIWNLVGLLRSVKS